MVTDNEIAFSLCGLHMSIVIATYGGVWLLIVSCNAPQLGS